MLRWMRTNYPRVWQLNLHILIPVLIILTTSIWLLIYVFFSTSALASVPLMQPFQQILIMIYIFVGCVFYIWLISQIKHPIIVNTLADMISHILLFLGLILLLQAPGIVYENTTFERIAKLGNKDVTLTEASFYNQLVSDLEAVAPSAPQCSYGELQQKSKIMAFLGKYGFGVKVYFKSDLDTWLQAVNYRCKEVKLQENFLISKSKYFKLTDPKEYLNDAFGSHKMLLETFQYLQAKEGLHFGSISYSKEQVFGSLIASFVLLLVLKHLNTTSISSANGRFSKFLNALFNYIRFPARWVDSVLRRNMPNIWTLDLLPRIIIISTITGFCYLIIKFTEVNSANLEPVWLLAVVVIPWIILPKKNNAITVAKQSVLTFFVGMTALSFLYGISSYVILLILSVNDTVEPAYAIEFPIELIPMFCIFSYIIIVSHLVGSGAVFASIFAVLVILFLVLFGLLASALIIAFVVLLFVVLLIVNHKYNNTLYKLGLVAVTIVNANGMFLAYDLEFSRMNDKHLVVLVVSLLSLLILAISLNATAAANRLPIKTDPLRQRRFTLVTRCINYILSCLWLKS